MYEPPGPRIDQLIRTFSYHAPQGSQTTRYESLRSQARQLAIHIVTLTPPSREQSLALTSLQEVVMYANAAIAIHETWIDGQLVAPTEGVVKQETT